MADLLESIYEQDFHEFSYAFRPRRGAHQALRDVRQGMQSRIHHVIDCDISAFFDNPQHHKLLEILRKRVKDGRVLELIELWLKAGIMDNRELVFPEKGSPQGSVISPLLGNVYLQEVLDTWFAEVVTERCKRAPTGRKSARCMPAVLRVWRRRPPRSATMAIRRQTVRNTRTHHTDSDENRALNIVEKRGASLFCFAKARQFMLNIFKSCHSDRYQLVFVSPGQFEPAWQLRERYQDKPKISFVDLTSMVIMQDLAITEVFTGDSHFEQVGLGFHVVP